MPRCPTNCPTPTACFSCVSAAIANAYMQRIAMKSRDFRNHLGARVQLHRVACINSSTQSHCERKCTWLRSLSAFLVVCRANCRTVTGPCSHMDRLVTSHPCRWRLSSMVWSSTTTCTPRRPRRRLRPLPLRSMPLSLRWLPSMAKHEKMERILHLRAKKYMWSIHKCDHISLGHCDTKWALPIPILRSQSLPTFPLESQCVCHAYTHIQTKLSHHSLQTSPHSLPPTRLLFIPVSSRHIVMSASHRRCAWIAQLRHTPT